MSVAHARNPREMQGLSAVVRDVVRDRPPRPRCRGVSGGWGSVDSAGQDVGVGSNLRIATGMRVVRPRSPFGWRRAPPEGSDAVEVQGPPPAGRLFRRSSSRFLSAVADEWP
jgi:hypothetical protein